MTEIQARIALWNRAQEESSKARNNRKRKDHQDGDSIENISNKRIDIKYDEVEALTLRSTFRTWTDWKADLERVWAGAPWKYQRDSLKIIKAVSKMDKACRARWNAYVRINKNKEDDYNHFLDWTRTLVRNNISFETTVYEEYERAKQRENQSPVDFDAYLSSIERELPETPDWVLAHHFYAKLDEPVVNQIKLSGLRKLPRSRSEMVALAQRVWEGIRPRRDRPRSFPPRPRNNQFNGNRQPRSNKESEGWKFTKSKDSKKQEVTCFNCGQPGHIRPNCPNKEKDSAEARKAKLKPRIQQQSLLQRVTDPQLTTNDESSENE